METIGSFEAKTQFSRLLAEVRKGKDYIITNRGVPVARLVPFIAKEEQRTFTELMDKFQSLRAKLQGAFHIKDMIEDGRKH